MIQLSELFPPRPEPSWKLIRQCGVTTVVGVLNGAEQDQRMFASVGAAGWKPDASDDAPWSERAMARNVETYRDHGFELIEQGIVKVGPPIALGGGVGRCRRRPARQFLILCRRRRSRRRSMIVRAD